MFTMAGTIKNSVRMVALDQKWQQKKNSFGQDKKKLAEMTAEERQLQDFREQEKPEACQYRCQAGSRGRTYPGRN